MTLKLRQTCNVIKMIWLQFLKHSSDMFFSAENVPIFCNLRWPFGNAGIKYSKLRDKLMDKCHISTKSCVPQGLGALNTFIL